jgi:AcrR family transcriptional regulator
MSDTALENNTKIESDGRKQRTNDTRQKIIKAMLQLILEGTVSPNADQVAARAEVGLRTVFRRFNEMEVLFRELAGEIHRTFTPEFNKPILGDTWQQKLFDLLERKIAIYEIVRPYRDAAYYHMYTSDYLRENLERWDNFEKNILQTILPFKEKDNLAVFSALSVCMGYHSWRSFTFDCELSKEQTLQAMTTAVTALIKDI